MLRLLKNRKGQGATEYIVVGSIVILLAVAVSKLLNQKVVPMVTSISDSLSH